jgi:hypothetical protein
MPGGACAPGVWLKTKKRPKKPQTECIDLTGPDPSPSQVTPHASNVAGGSDVRAAAAACRRGKRKRVQTVKSGMVDPTDRRVSFSHSDPPSQQEIDAKFACDQPRSPVINLTKPPRPPPHRFSPATEAARPQLKPTAAKTAAKTHAVSPADGTGANTPPPTGEDEADGDGCRFVGKRIQLWLRRYMCADDDTIRCVAEREQQNASEMLRVNRESMFEHRGEGTGRNHLELDSKLTAGKSMLLVPDTSSCLSMTVIEYLGWERLPTTTVKLLTGKFQSWQRYYHLVNGRWWREIWSVREAGQQPMKISSLDLFEGLGYNTAADAEFMGENVLLVYPNGREVQEVEAKVVACPRAGQQWWLLLDDDGERCELNRKELLKAMANKSGRSARVPRYAASNVRSRTCFLELFSGQCTVSKVARRHFGDNAVILTVDIDERLAQYANAIPGTTDQTKKHFIQDIFLIRDAWLKSLLKLIERMGCTHVSGAWASICCTTSVS